MLHDCSGRTGGPASRLRRGLMLVLSVLALGAPVAGFAQTPPAGAPAPTTSLEPDREALRAAYSAQLAAVNAGAGQVLDAEDAARVQIEMEDLQKLVCRPIEREGVHYDCRVEIRIRLPGQRPQTSIVNLWLERTAEGWVSR